MKPYIGILIDSFWEAVSNRVLWALLICWTIVLACLAPFGYVSERSFSLVSSDIDNRSQLLEKIAKAAKGGGKPATKAVVAQLDEEFIKKVQKNQKDQSVRIRSSELAEELNKALKSPDLYSEEAFPTANRRQKLQPLIAIAPEARSESDNEELNRKLMQLAFPLELEENFGERLWIGYGGFKIGRPLPFSRRTAREFIEPLALSFIIKVGLGVLAVFVAIIVTSPIIPDTFRSGSLHLLLSKPISRVLLYLSKFFGGTIFVLVNVTFVLVGLYLIAGTRFEIWNNGLLLCIPLLMFVFVIFYSVSGLAGLIWHNAIVCVVSCIVFWFCCFCLGVARGIFQPELEINAQIAKVTQIGEDVTAVNEKGDFNVWNPEFSVWQPAIDSEMSGGPKRTYGPIYDPERQKVLVKSFIRNPFGGVFATSRAINIIDLEDESVEEEVGGSESEEETASSKDSPETTSADPEAGEQAHSDAEGQGDASQEASAAEMTPEGDAQFVGEDEDEDEEEEATSTRKRGPQSTSEAREKARWVYDAGPEVPAQCFGLYQMQDGVVAICRSGVYRLNLEQLDAIEASEKALFGLLKLSPLMSNNAFKKVTPADFLISDKANPAPTANGSGVIVYTPTKLELLEMVGEEMEVTKKYEWNEEEDDSEETAKDVAALVRMNDEYCVLARDGMPFQVFDKDLQPVAEVELESDMQVKQIAFQPDTNRLSIVTHAGQFMYLDCEAAKLEYYELPVSDVTSVNWIDGSQVWLGCRPNLVYRIDLSGQEILATFDPTPSVFENVYNFAIKPLYEVLPKPSALDDAMLYVLTGSDTQSLSVVTSDLEAAKLELSVWPPILSNLAFVIVVLGISSIYVARKEF